MLSHIYKKPTKKLNVNLFLGRKKKLLTLIADINNNFKYAQCN